MVSPPRPITQMHSAALAATEVSIVVELLRQLLNHVGDTAMLAVVEVSVVIEVVSEHLNQVVVTAKLAAVGVSAVVEVLLEILDRLGGTTALASAMAAVETNKQTNRSVDAEMGQYLIRKHLLSSCSIVDSSKKMAIKCSTTGTSHLIGSTKRHAEVKRSHHSRHEHTHRGDGKSAVCANISHQLTLGVFYITMHLTNQLIVIMLVIR